METKENEFSAYRLKRDTITGLQQLKDAFELSYGRPFTNDEFIMHLVSAVEDGDPAVWEIFCEIIASRQKISAMARESRKKMAQQ